jgi:DNA-binding response OmpR family regulator
LSQAAAREDGYILIVEDDAAIASVLQMLLSDAGLVAEVAHTGQQALATVERECPKLVLLDLGLPGLYGTSLAVTLRMRWPSLPFIVISALPDLAVAQDAWSIGAAAYFTKPFDVDDLTATVRRILSSPFWTPARRTSSRAARPA